MSAHGVNASDDLDMAAVVLSAQEGAANGYDLLDSQLALVDLKTEESALEALRVYAAPGTFFDIDKALAACAAYRFHKHK